MFEIKKRDGLGRIGKLKIKDKVIETPTLAVVLNPNNMIVDMKFIKRYIKPQLIMTNAYILMRSKYRDEIIEKGIHKFFGFDGVIYTDSGTFQMYSRGDVKISNEQTIEFQKKIKSDIITPLDVFTLPEDSYKESKRKMEETLKRISYLRKTSEEEKIEYVFPIQGGRYISLREEMAEKSNKYDATLYAIGGIVPLMEQYRYRELMKIIFAIKSKINPSFPIHAFGAGHPMIFGLLVMAGIDIFDSASYSLYAQEGRYLTENKTLDIKEIEYLPCDCPVCIDKTPKEMSKEDIAKHNLFIIFKEIRRIKESIRTGNLYEYVEQRIGAHPELIKAYRLLKDKKIKALLIESESSTKQTSIYWVRDETKYRPVFEYVRRKLKFVNSDLKKFRWYNNLAIPISLSLTYPFGQFQYIKSFEKYKEMLKKIFASRDKEMIIKVVRDILAWELESTNIYNYKKLEKCDYEISHTKRLRYILHKGKTLATLRAQDNIFVLSKEFAKELYNNNILSKKVIVKEEAKAFIRKGRNVFAKFIIDCSDNIHPNDVVAILDEHNEFLNVGFALLTSKEMKSFKRGVAVNVKG